MTIRRGPRRQLVLDSLYRDRGGVRAFVFDALDRGERVPDIARQLSAVCDERISVDTLYAWIRAWRREADVMSSRAAEEEVKT